MRLFEIFSAKEFWNYRNQSNEFIDNITSLIFSSESEARKKIYTELMSRQKNDLFYFDDSFINEIIKYAPIYKTTRGYKIGYNEYKPKISINELKIKHESKKYIVDTAEANAIDFDIDFSIIYYDLKNILPNKDNDIYLKDKKEISRLEILSNDILNNKIIVPIIVGEEYEDDDSDKIYHHIIEGQHRARVFLYYLDIPKIPAYTIKIY